MTEAVLIDIVRTASGKGKPGGALSGMHPIDLMAGVLQSLLGRVGIDPAEVDDVILGCVTQAGEQAGNLARFAVLGAGLPESVPATTINRACGSSQQAVHFAVQAVKSGASDIVIAGGVESMSRVPIPTAAMGRDARGTMARARYPDGFTSQGVAAELVADAWKLARSELDSYSARSHQRAARARASGWFDHEIVPVTVTDASGSERSHTIDETVRAGTTAESLAALTPVFATEAERAVRPHLDWRVTAGTSSPLTDGASAALIMSGEAAQRLGLTARARFVAGTVAGADPLLMLTAPIPATRRVLERAGLGLADLAAYEVNEAFAPVPLAWCRELDADPDRLNPCGGAIALGHAIGASGTRLLATLLNHLERTGGRYGLQTMCEFGGMANAMVIERL
ncbi:thiolase family protein [Dactylosporangium sp. CA-092794]|uniref:thiolase family protein n=1 Tax=Dactylosporangium sp. CA-092794 TaxID=3239929 RepID=UPI003D8E0E1C